MHEIFSHTGKISPNFSAIKWKNMFGYDMWLLMAPVNKIQNKMKKNPESIRCVSAQSMILFFSTINDTYTYYWINNKEGDEAFVLIVSDCLKHFMMLRNADIVPGFTRTLAVLSF